MPILFSFAALRESLGREGCSSFYVFSSCGRRVPTHTKKKRALKNGGGELKVCEGLGSLLLLPRRAATAFKDLPLLSRHFFFICSTEPISDLSFSPPPPRKHLLPFCTTSRHLPSRVLWPALYIVIHK